MTTHNANAVAGRRLAAMQSCAALYEQALPGLFTMVVVGAMFVAIADKFAPHLDFGLWYIGVLGVIALRFALVAVYKKAQHLADPGTWIAFYIVGAAVVAAQIAWAAVVLIDIENITLTAITSTLLFGTATGAIPVLASAWRGYLLYIFVLLAPVIIELASQATGAPSSLSTGTILAISGALLLVVLSVVSLNYSRAIIRGNLSELDPLTQCANRRLLERALRTQRTPAGKRPAALALIDLDRFKTVNDTAGHEAGDHVLISIARMLESIVDDEDVVARIGGDEFAVLFSERNLDSINERVEKVRIRIGEHSFHHDAHTFRVSTSIGFVALDGQTLSPSGAIASADIAAYAAKKHGGNRIRQFSLDDDDMLENQSDLEWRTRIEEAIANNKLSLVCQEIVSVQPGSAGSDKLRFETLVRMVTEEGNLVPAADFVPAVERLGLSGQLDRWVVSNTIEWAARNAQLLEEIEWLTVNLSVRTVGDRDFAQFVDDLLIKSGLSPAKFCFELTEHEAILDYSSVLAFMTRLSDMGCRFALDDFGTGYSSLKYLNTLPVEIIKIDRVFVDGAVKNPADRAILCAIHELAGNLNKAVVAEGVEDEATMSLLRELGINMMQGYGIMMPEKLEDWTARKTAEMRDRKTPAPAENRQRAAV